MASNPSQAATGTLTNNPNEITSQAIMTGRLRSRSIQAPAGNANSNQGSQAEACSSPTVNVLASSTSTATSGIATTVTDEPTLLVVSPNQNHRKSRCHNSPPIRAAGVVTPGVGSITDQPGGPAFPRRSSFATR